eukprot:2428613-Prymnesium_polylepis.1
MTSESSRSKCTSAAWCARPERPLPAQGRAMVTTGEGSPTLWIDSTLRPPCGLIPRCAHPVD